MSHGGGRFESRTEPSRESSYTNRSECLASSGSPGSCHLVWLLALVQVRLLNYIQRGLVLVAVDPSRKPFDKTAIDNLVLADGVVQEAVVDFMSHCMRGSIRYSACWGMCRACLLRCASRGQESLGAARGQRSTVRGLSRVQRRSRCFPAGSHSARRVVVAACCSVRHELLGGSQFWTKTASFEIRSLSVGFWILWRLCVFWESIWPCFLGSSSSCFSSVAENDDVRVSRDLGRRERFGVLE